MALAQPGQRGLKSGDRELDENRDAWRLLFLAFCRGGDGRAGSAVVEVVLAVLWSGMFDPYACHPGRGCAVQQAPLPPCNDRNVSLHRVLLPMQAKASDQEDRQARQPERSSRSSTRSRMEGNLKVYYLHTQ